MYTVDYFINKFEAIPECLWLEREFRRGQMACVMGHCADVQEERNALEDLFKLHSHLFSPVEIYGHGAWYFEQMVNNGDDPKYQQPTPKARILAALHDIKAMQEKEQPQPERIKTVYVSVPETVKAQSKELILS